MGKGDKDKGGKVKQKKGEKGKKSKGRGDSDSDDEPEGSVTGSIFQGSTSKASLLKTSTLMLDNSGKSIGDSNTDYGDDDNGDYVGKNDISMELSEAVELLNEKRPSERSKGLIILLRLIRSGVDIREYIESICTLLTRLLKRPTDTQEALSCITILCLISLTLGQDEEDFYLIFEPILSKIYNSSEYDDEIRSAALSGCAFMCYICSNDGVEKLLSTLEDLYCEEYDDNGNEVSCIIIVAAAHSWMLLATRISNESCLERSQENMFAASSEYLNNQDTDIRMASGEILAFLWEISESITPNLEAIDSGKLLCRNTNLITNTLGQLKKISKECSKHISKKDRKEQRAAFRDIEASICFAEKMTDSIRMSGCTIEINSFAIMVLIEFLRHYLTDGFQSSTRHFDVIKEILQINHLDEEGMKTTSIITKASNTGKLRSGYRKQERNYRDINKDGLADDYDGYEE